MTGQNNVQESLSMIPAFQALAGSAVIRSQDSLLDDGIAINMVRVVYSTVH